MNIDNIRLRHRTQRMKKLPASLLISDLKLEASELNLAEAWKRASEEGLKNRPVLATMPSASRIFGFVARKNIDDAIITLSDQELAEKLGNFGLLTGGFARCASEARVRVFTDGSSRHPDLANHKRANSIFFVKSLSL